VPAFSYVIPDECHDMHGDPPYCLDGGNPGDSQDQHLVTVGDDYLGHLVSSITNAKFWAKGNNAISIVFDEGDDNAGCCDASSGGGKVANVVVTSHGPRNLQDPTPYNHYSLLQTVQSSLGVGCLEFTCDTTNVKPLAKLFAVENTSAVATTPLPVPNYPTPSPTPNEPSSLTSKTPTAGGWTVVKSPLLGTSDNSLGAVAASSPNDIWAVGNFLPDTANSNQDATLSLANHFDGKSWTAVPTPNTGSNFNTLFGVAARNAKAWAVGVNLDNQYRNRALIESWDGSQWSIADNPQPGSQRDILFAVSAVSPSDVWAVGDQEGPDGKFETLVEHWDGATWTVSPSANPGTSGNHLYGVTAIGPDDVWAVGQQLGVGAPDQGLIEHWDGQKWSVVASPGHGSANTLLDSVASGNDGLWAVGETDDAHQGGRPLIEQFMNGSWTDAALPPAGSNWTNLYGVTESQAGTWAVGTFVDPASGNNQTLLLRRNGQRWSVVSGPNPGSGSNILGGIALAGETLWSVGTYEDGGSRLTLIERH
jgi:hypothetical protein